MCEWVGINMCILHAVFMEDLYYCQFKQPGYYLLGLGSIYYEISLPRYILISLKFPLLTILTIQLSIYLDIFG